MNLRKTLLLGIVLLIGVAYLTKVYMPGRQQEVGQRMAFARLDMSRVESVEIARRADEGASGERYTMVHTLASSELVGDEKKATNEEKMGQWALAALRGAVVDSQQAQAMITALRDLSVEGPLDEKDIDRDLGVYGLDKPDLTTVVRQRDSASTEIAFGKENAYLSKRYVKISGRPGVFLAEESAFQALNKSSKDVRAKTPFVFASADVRELELTSEAGRIKISQPIVGEWRIDEPRSLAASSEAVGELLSAIQEISASDFIDGQQDRRDQYGFGAPLASARLVFREGAGPREISVSVSKRSGGGPTAEEFFVTSSESDTIFKVAADPSMRLLKRVDDMRERRVLALTASAMERVVSAGQGISPVEIVTQGVAWTVNGKESDPEFVQQFLNDVGGLRAAEFPVQVPADAFENPYLTLTITKSGAEKQVITLTVGKEAAGAKPGETMRYARSSLSDTVYLIRDIEAKRITPHEEALVARSTPTPEPKATLP